MMKTLPLVIFTGFISVSVTACDIAEDIQVRDVPPGISRLVPGQGLPLAAGSFVKVQGDFIEQLEVSQTSDGSELVSWEQVRQLYCGPFPHAEGSPSCIQAVQIAAPENTSVDLKFRNTETGETVHEASYEIISSDGIPPEPPVLSLAWPSEAYWVGSSREPRLPVTMRIVPSPDSDTAIIRVIYQLPSGSEVEGPGIDASTSGNSALVTVEFPQTTGNGGDETCIHAIAIDYSGNVSLPSDTFCPSENGIDLSSPDFLEPEAAP